VSVGGPGSDADCRDGAGEGEVEWHGMCVDDTARGFDVLWFGSWFGS
jgi:hypothetical protein